MAEDVSLLALARNRKRLRGSRCTLRKLFDLRPELADDLSALLANCGENGEGISYAVSAEVIGEAFGTKIEGQTISRHLHGRCACS